MPIVDTVEPWCYEATRDNIRHYAHGIGDDNPLWCDPAYAAGTAYGTVIAPPSFVFALDRDPVRLRRRAARASTPCGPAPTSRGTRRSFATRRSRRRPTSKDLVEHETRFAGRAIQQIYHVDIDGGRRHAAVRR